MNNWKLEVAVLDASASIIVKNHSLKFCIINCYHISIQTFNDF